MKLGRSPLAAARPRDIEIDAVNPSSGRLISVTKENPQKQETEVLTLIEDACLGGTKFERETGSPVSTELNRRFQAGPPVWTRFELLRRDFAALEPGQVIFLHTV